MACYAVATIRGWVQLAEKLAEYLQDPVLVANVMTGVLKAGGYLAGVVSASEQGVFVDVRNEKIDARLVYRNGEIQAEGRGWSASQQDLDAITEAVRAGLVRAAGVILQQKVRATANRIGFVKSNQMIGDVMVLTVSVK